MAGPFCGLQLADLGAEVTKIEHPRGGDLARFLEPFVDGESGNFARLNRDKRSVAIDLKREKGQQIFRQLAKTADIIVENLRPGTMADLGLSPASLMEADPHLVYVAVTGWGLDGPYADRPALDIIVQGQSGLMSVTGEEAGGPVKVGVSIADLSAGLYATIATLAALRARDRYGMARGPARRRRRLRRDRRLWRRVRRPPSRGARVLHRPAAPVARHGPRAWIAAAPRAHPGAARAGRSTTGRAQR